MDPITIMSTTTPPIVPQIITSNGAPWTPVEAALVPCAICAVWDPVGAVTYIVVTCPSVWVVIVRRAVGTLWTPVESLEAERLANVP